MFSFLIELFSALQNALKVQRNCIPVPNSIVSGFWFLVSGFSFLFYFIFPSVSFQPTLLLRNVSKRTVKWPGRFGEYVY